MDFKKSDVWFQDNWSLHKFTYYAPKQSIRKVSFESDVKLLNTLFFLAAPHGLQDISSLTRDGTQGLGSESAKS